MFNVLFFLDSPSAVLGCTVCLLLIKMFLYSSVLAMCDPLNILGDVILKLFSKVPALNLVISKYPKSLGAL